MSYNPHFPPGWNPHFPSSSAPASAQQQQQLQLRQQRQHQPTGYEPGGALPPFDSYSTQQYNLNTSHPIIPNAQNYMYYRKYLSVHSEDRDITKFPNSNEFEFEAPQDYCNVASIRLSQWTFPANYNTFSTLNANVNMTFKITTPYNPAANGVTSILNQRIYQALLANADSNYAILIQEGFYNPNQMITELTNKFNFTVSNWIREYFVAQGYTDSLAEFNAEGGYTRFIIVYNNVSLKIWFGNSADGFTLTNETALEASTLTDKSCADGRSHLPDFSNWGLPSYLGLVRCDTAAINGENIEAAIAAGEPAPAEYDTYGDNGVIVPRFFYGDVTPGDQGFWLVPNAGFTGSQVYWVEATYKINLMGYAYIYMEMEGQNCMDETSPFALNSYTYRTNETNGVVNSAFAKLGIPSTPMSQWFDQDSLPYKYYYPAAERMRRFHVKFRYHDGQPVNMGVFNFSFTLEFTLQQPQMLRNSHSVMYPGAERR